MKKLLTLFTLLLTVCSGAWGDELFTLNSDVTTSDTTFPFSSDGALDKYTTYNSNSKLFKVEKNGTTVKFKNKNGYEITAITVDGVAHNGSDKTATITISDGSHTASTGEVSMHARGDADGDITTGVTMTGVTSLLHGVNQEYTVSSSYAVAIRLNITYTTSGGGATKYTVTYDVNGGGSCATASETQASAGAALTLPTPTWTGYTFNGWYNAGSKIGDADAKYTPTADITLYAKWTDNTEGKLFSYVDGNYGNKFRAFDDSGWVTANADNKSKTFTDVTTGAQYIITNGTWEKKNNSISALAKFKNGTTGMSIKIPTGYQATVKILYGAYGTGDDYKMTVKGTAQAKPNAAFDDGHTNAQIASDMKEITLNNQSGTLDLSVNGSKNIYIGRVAVVLTKVSGTITDAGWNTFSSKVALNLSTLSATSEVKAYYASAASDGKVTMSSTDAIVPAGEGLMIKGTVGEVFTIDAATGNGTNIVGNLLEGLPNGGTVAKNDNNYVFAWQTGNVSTTAGFYYVNDAEPTLDAGKAYLHTTTPLSGKLNIIIDDSTSQEEETDGIKAISTNVENGVRYNLAGQKVGADYKGIVIVNGKKVIIK